mmetsp:Transcript_3962/g.5345  ORF Transcript_3962/g.5345 Transcript_3962/m.5345 type:complete len:85 (-) Transcript_3962:7-261(-)
MRRQRQTGESSDAEGNTSGFAFGDPSSMNSANVGGSGDANKSGANSGGGETIGHATAAAAASTWDIEEGEQRIRMNSIFVWGKT